MTGKEFRATCNATALRGASRRLSQIYDDVLTPVGLRATQFAVLNRIDRRGPGSLNGLADELAMDRSTLGHNLRPLERDGLVVLGRDPADRRTRTIALSPKGRTKLAEARPLWAKTQAAFEKTFGKDRAALLRDLLHEIAAGDFLAKLNPP